MSASSFNSQPMLFLRDGSRVCLASVYHGHGAFLICGGPSLKSHNLAKLNARGILTCGVNNAAAVFRPHLWVSADNPGNFCDAIWKDPAILKFVATCHMDTAVLSRNDREELVPSGLVVREMPTVFGYERNEEFNADTWLHEDTFNWGNEGGRVDAYGIKGSRSVLLIALRLLFYLGIRRVYLLGCDFRMALGRNNYAFPQDRSPASVRSNNRTYRILNVRLSHLKPHFDREGFVVLNCTPDSGLKVFPYISYEDAVREAASFVPSTIITEGMYDHAKNKSRGRLRTVGEAPVTACHTPERE